MSDPVKEYFEHELKNLLALWDSCGKDLETAEDRRQSARWREYAKQYWTAYWSIFAYYLDILRELAEAKEMVRKLKERDDWRKRLFAKTAARLERERDDLRARSGLTAVCLICGSCCQRTTVEKEGDHEQLAEDIRRGLAKLKEKERE